MPERILRLDFKKSRIIVPTFVGVLNFMTSYASCVRTGENFGDTITKSAIAAAYISGLTVVAYRLSDWSKKV